MNVRKGRSALYFTHSEKKIVFRLLPLLCKPELPLFKITKEYFPMSMRPIRPVFFLLIVTLLAAGQILAKGSGDGVWREVRETTALRSSQRLVVPSKYRTFALDRTMLQTILASAPEEMRGFGVSNTILSFPMPDGTFQRFRIEHSPIVEAGLSAKYPELAMTFLGHGIDDPTATIRFDLMPSGFHSMILSPRGTVLVDPYGKNDTGHYVSYLKEDAARSSDFSCGFDPQNAVDSISKAKKKGFQDFVPESALASPSVTSGTQLRTYRLAVAATNEYAQVVGGNTVAGTLAAQTTIMNRVNGIYERDLAIRMVMIANNNLIIYAGDQLCGGVACTGANDPYTNNNGSTMLTENINNVNAVIGSANYDMGHVFSTGGGGIAGLGVVCGASKARGVTGLGNPVGDAFAIDYVAHELGHQWGGNHTFNGGVSNCEGGNRSASSAYEPGSGITIMGYAGICGNQNLAGNSIDSFHVKSLEEIVAYSQVGQGNTCAAPTATGNTPPSVTIPAGTTYNIPKQTPFTLTANATDVNGDTVTYDWQEYDLGAVTTLVPNDDTDGSPRPIFRVFAPTSGPSRTFPHPMHILATGNVPPSTTGGFLTGEILPSIARTMNFQVIARDNRANGGGINTATVTVNVAATGPFQVTSPDSNVTWFLGSNPVVTWNTGGSESAPMNFANVRILLSTDGGATFPTVLAASTANDGSEAVVSPALDTTTARIRIEPIGGIFFDVSNTNFTISNVAASNGPIAGRIVRPDGRGVGRVYVLLTGGGLVTPRVALTNVFGYYRFDTVGFGQSYTITPQPRKGTTFTPTSLIRNHTADAFDQNFTTN